jgi:hypothetical protein
MQSLKTLCVSIAAAGLMAACSSESGRSVLVPTDVSATVAGGAAHSSSSSLLGTWTQAATFSNRAIGSLPAPNSCSAFQFTMTSQSATQATGNFTASCPGDLTLNGTISGQLGGATIPMVITGVATAPGEPGCPFVLNGNGVLVTPNELRIDYTGNTCLGPVSGSATLRQSSPTPPPAPAPPSNPAPSAPPPSSSGPDPLLGCGSLVAGGDPYQVIACIHDRLNPPHTPEGAFEITKRVAWAYRSEGAGLLIKNGGENIVAWKGMSFSAGRICLPDGHIYKILSDVPTTNAPSFQDNGYVDPGLYVPAIDPNS